MIPVRFRFLPLAAAAILAVSACTGASSTAKPTATPAPTPTLAPSATPVPATPTPLPTAPASQLVKPGTLTVCSDTEYPPQEYIDPSTNKPIGSDIDLVAEIAKRMGLKLDVKTTVFKTIIPALTGGTCDIIVSAQTINADLQKAVDMIPYFEAGQSFVVLTGNPSHIQAITDLCGKKVAAEAGTVEAEHISGGEDYAPADTLNAQCKAAGKADITVQIFDADTAALAALQAGSVVAHFTDEPVAGYEVVHGNGAFQVLPSLTLEHAPEGISVAKNHPELRDAVKAALKSMIADGTYLQILTKWGAESGKLSTPLQ